VKVLADDLFGAPLNQTEIDFENEGGETYICGNPPYLGSKWQSDGQKAELGAIFDDRVKNWKTLDYVAGWFMKAADYGTKTESSAAFVATNSICQGQQVPILWPRIFQTGNQIAFCPYIVQVGKPSQPQCGCNGCDCWHRQPSNKKYGVCSCSPPQVTQSPKKPRTSTPTCRRAERLD
jgi:hypothetical protein